MSTNKQAESGLSIEAQEEKIRAMAITQDAELIGIEIDEAESAKDMNRPGAQRVMDMVKKRQVSMVLITKLDRFTRSIRSLADVLDVFEKKGVKLVSQNESLDTSTPVGRLVINVIVSVLQWEREEVGVRTGIAMRVKRERGEQTGFVPYGYRSEPTDRVNKKGEPIMGLVPEPAEQAIIERIKTERAAGKSLREIAMDLNKDHLHTRSGQFWQFQYIANILKKQPQSKEAQ